MPLGEIEQRLAVRLGHILGGHLRPFPRRARAARRLALEAHRRLVLERRDRLDVEHAQLVRREPLPDPPLELRERPLERVVVRRAGVPAIRAVALRERDRVLHERDALALDRVRHQDLRPLGLGTKILERLAQIEVVVAVAGVDVPAEAP